MLSAFETRQLDVQTGIEGDGRRLAGIPGDRMMRTKQIDARIVGHHQAVKAPFIPQHVC